MQKPIVTVVYQKDDWDMTVPFSNPLYRDAYEKLYTVAAERGIKMTRASMHWLTNKGFSRGWTFENGTWKKIKAFKPGLIWDKSPYRISLLPKKRRLHRQFPVINSIALEQIVSDKFLTHLIFPKFTAKTFVVHNRQEAKQAAKQIPSKQVVLKPSVGTGGKNVRIISKRAINTQRIKPFTLIQEYLDASKGIPNLTPGHHDLRVTLMNGKVLYSSIRKPPKGSRIANIARGGSYEIIPVRKIPAAVRKITKEVDTLLKPVGDRYYSVDFIYSRGRPYVVELNGTPGVDVPEKLQDRIYHQLVSFFENFLD